MKKNDIFRNFIIIITALTAVFALSGSIMHESVSFDVNLTGIDEESGELYCDMLIKLSEGDKWYTDFNSVEGLPFSSDSDLARYSEGGYRSISFHFRDAVNREGQWVTIPEKWENDHGGSNAAFRKFCRGFKTAKIAVTDEQGNIVSVSEEFDLVCGGLLPILSSIGYDLTTGEVKVTYDANAMNGAIAGSLVRVWISVGLLLAYFIISSLIARKLGNKHRLNVIVSLLMNLPFVNLCIVSMPLLALKMSDGIGGISKLIFYAIAGFAAVLFVSGEFINAGITAYFIGEWRKSRKPQADDLSG